MQDGRILFYWASLCGKLCGGILLGRKKESSLTAEDFFATCGEELWAEKEKTVCGIGGRAKKKIKGKGERLNRTVGFLEIAFSSIHPKEDRLKNIYKSSREYIL